MSYRHNFLVSFKFLLPFEGATYLTLVFNPLGIVIRDSNYLILVFSPLGIQVKLKPAESIHLTI